MKALLIPTVLLALGVGTLGSAQAATQGTLTFEGSVANGTCNLSTDDANRIITLPTVQSSQFVGSGSIGHETFNLTAECDSGFSSVTFVFAGEPDAIDGWRFANKGTADNVALQLASIDGEAIRAGAGGEYRSRTVDVESGLAVLPMRAGYWQTGATVSSGTFHSVVTVAISYQ